MQLMGVLLQLIVSTKLKNWNNGTLFTQTRASCIDESRVEEDEQRSSDLASQSELFSTEAESSAVITEKAKVAEKESRYRRLLSISGTRFIARTRNLRIFHKKTPSNPISTDRNELGFCR